jgi:hypothetical protein
MKYWEFPVRCELAVAVPPTPTFRAAMNPVKAVDHGDHAETQEVGIVTNAALSPIEQWDNYPAQA